MRWLRGMPTSEPHTGRVALVTGAAHGIGQAIAAGLAERGTRIVLGDIDDMSEASDLIGATAHPAAPVTPYVSDPSSIEDQPAGFCLQAPGAGAVDGICTRWRRAARGFLPWRVSRGRGQCQVVLLGCARLGDRRPADGRVHLHRDEVGRRW